MDDVHSAKIMKALVAFMMVILFFKMVVFGSWLKSDVQKGPGYSFTPPPGWEKVKEPRGVSAVLETNEKPDVVTFAVPEKISGTDIPVASMSILTAKLANPTWMEDEFPNLLGALNNAGYRVIDQGQIEIDTMVCWWVFFQNPQTTMVNLEFYAVNDINRLYKIQYTADPDAFKEYRPIFEAAKDTVKFSEKLW